MYLHVLFYLEKRIQTATVVSAFLKPMQLMYFVEKDALSEIASILCSHYYVMSSKW